ncbi:MAG TPA: hypothetical protein VHE55_02900 [Fimbriimonadaceae bacterium]|nr:hypothetical protein [Fimbriimonadaceae bacterium]
MTRATYWSMAILLSAVATHANAQSQSLYDVYVVPANATATKGKPVGGSGHDAIRRTDSLRVTVHGPALGEFLNRQRGAGQAPVIPESLVQKFKQASNGAAMAARASASGAKANVAPGPEGPGGAAALQASGRDIVNGIQQIISAAGLPGAAGGASPTDAKGIIANLNGLFGKGPAMLPEEGGGGAAASAAPDLIGDARSKGAAVRAALLSQLQPLADAIQAAKVDVTADLIVSRDTSTNRTPDANPLSIFAGDQSKLKDLQQAAKDALSGIAAAQNELKDFGPKFSAFLTTVGNAVKQEIANLGEKNGDGTYKYPNLGPATAVLDGIPAHLQTAADDLSNAGSNPLQYLLGPAQSDFQIIQSDIDNFTRVVQGLTMLTEPEKQAVNTALTDIKTAMQSSDTVKLFLGLSAFFKEIQPVYEEIDRVTQSAVGNTNGDFDLPDFVNTDSSFNKASLRSEDRIQIKVSAKFETDKDYVDLPPVTTLYAFRDTYWVSSTAALGIHYTHDNAFKPGAAQFASYHFLNGSSAGERMNFGLAIGFGTATRANSDAADTIIALGLSFYRDSVIAGVGRNTSANQNFWFVGLRFSTNIFGGN